MSSRAAFEAWLLAEQGLDSNWNEERNCFDDFPAHLAYKAWCAAFKVCADFARDIPVMRQISPAHVAVTKPSDVADAILAFPLHPKITGGE